MLFTVCVASVFIFFLVTYRYLTQYRGSIEKLGIPIIPPWGVLGSPPFDIHNTDFRDYYVKNFKKHGKTFGFYEGIMPVVATLDPEIIKSVLVKNFDSFTDIVNFPVEDKNMTLDISTGQTWKDLRKNLSPTFTSGKLKGMLEPMSEVADRMVAHADKLCQDDNVINVKELFQGLAMDTIAKCAFGIETDCYNNPNQDIIKYGIQVFSEFRSTNWITTFFFLLIQHFPFLVKVIPAFPPAIDKMNDITKDIIKNREMGQITGKDFIARLMEMKRMKKENPKAEFLSSLNEEIISSQGTIFFLAGYETTANTLSTFCYNLSKYPDMQQRVFEEIRDVSEAHDGVIDHETIGEMEFLEAAINENLRLNGPVTLHFRVCNKDCEVVPGFHIKKGTRIDLPVWACHHNEEFFPDPEQFILDRFLKENKDSLVPHTFRPFGGGPRLCIGLRFAMTEMKLAVAKLLIKYEVKSTPKTKLDVYKGDQFLIMYPDMIVKLEQRN